MSTYTQEEFARTLAVRLHGEQKYGTEPYVVHLTAVREVLRDFNIEGDLAIAAWLHDVVEDTKTTREDIEALFGAHVASLVWAVSGFGVNRKARSADAYAKIQAYPEAATLKLADRIANVEASASNPDKRAMYRKEFPGFAAALAGLGDERLWSRLRKAIGE